MTRDKIYDVYICTFSTLRSGSLWVLKHHLSPFMCVWISGRIVHVAFPGHFHVRNMSLPLLLDVTFLDLLCYGPYLRLFTPPYLLAPSPIITWWSSLWSCTFLYLCTTSNRETTTFHQVTVVPFHGSLPDIILSSDFSELKSSSSLSSVETTLSDVFPDLLSSTPSLPLTSVASV